LKSAHLNRVGYSLLFLYLVLALLLRNHQTFYDEGSNLNLASCVLKGLHLYRDLFENHFPLPVYLSAAIISLTGTSLPLVRLAVLLIDAAMFLAVMRVSKLYFPVGFAAAVWACVSPYYFGNMLLYDNLAMIGGIALGAVCFAVLARGLEPSRGMFALLAIAGLVATMSSPFFALVTFIAIGSLFIAPRIPKSFVLKLSAAIAAPIVIYFIYLAATGALGAFYSYAIVFNTTTYQQYTALPILPLIGKQLLLFDIFNPKWLSSFDPLRFNPISFSPVFDHWVFSGLFYRVAALLTCLLFVLRRDYRTAVFLYLFVAALPLREDDQFHAAPFVFFCLFLVGVLIQESTSHKLLALCAVPTLLLAGSGARYVARHALQSDFDRLTAEAQFIHEATQNHGDAQLGHYPYGNYMYYLTGLRPISKFVDFYPWVAEVGRAEVDLELARASSVVLAMDISGSIWTYPNSITLQSEIAYAKKYLIKESFGWLTVYVSPSLTMQGAAGTEAALTALAAPLDGAPVDINGAWSKKGSAYQSAGAGTIRFGPFHLEGHSEMAIPIMTGPDAHNLSVRLRNTATGNLLAHLDPPPIRTTWWAWRPDLPQDPELTFEILAEAKGTQWMAIGWPHWLRQAHPEKAFHPGVYRNGEWILGVSKYHFGGQPGDIPVTGDWDGSGRTKPGIYKSSGRWLLYGTNTTYQFGGQPGDIPVTGDWDGSGRTKPGIYKPATGEWLLYGTNKTYHFGGQPGDIPVPGDWDASGKTKPGIFRPPGAWLLYGDGNTYQFGGIPGDIPVVGDWDGDGRSKPGIFRRGSSWLLDLDGNYKFEDLGNDVVVTLGNPGDKPVAGLW
jgi:hypothetical protein